MWIAVIAALVVVLFFLSIYVIYRICFGEFREKYPEDCVEMHMPKGPAYEPFCDVIKKGICNVVEATEFETVEITSVDGLKLKGRYYHRRDGAPLIIFFHGYRGNFYRDGNGIFTYSKKFDMNVLLVYQRSQGQSEGKTITFGIMERQDCKSWVEYAIGRFGNHQEILLSGISMGGATVMMAADVGLPDNVKGIMTDCGFTSPKEILCSVMDSLKLPSKVFYPLAKLGAKWFGGVELEEASAVESMKHCKIPVLFIHGEEDDFVPCWMSRKCYEVCAAEKELLIVPGVGHGMSYCYGPKEYEAAIDRFFERTLEAKPLV